jgi:hypothetical protein
MRAQITRAWSERLSSSSPSAADDPGGLSATVALTSYGFVVYRRRLHIINLQSTVPATRRRDGYNLAHWSSGELRFSAAHNGTPRARARQQVCDGALRRSNI